MDNWQIEWTNPQKEPTYKAFTLILIAPNGKSYRIEKTFPNMELSSDYLKQIVKNEIKSIEAEENASE